MALRLALGNYKPAKQSDPLGRDYIFAYEHDGASPRPRTSIAPSSAAEPRVAVNPTSRWGTCLAA